MSRIADMANVVPGAWATIKARREEINCRDPKARSRSSPSRKRRRRSPAWRSGIGGRFDALGG